MASPIIATNIPVGAPAQNQFKFPRQGYGSRASIASRNVDVEPSMDVFSKNQDIHEYVEMFVKDQEWVNGWIETKRLKPLDRKLMKKNQLKISDSRNLLQKCLKNLENLREEREKLTEQMETYTNEEWKMAVDKINDQKTNVLKLMSIFSDKSRLAQLKRLVNQRKVKRRCGKKRKALAKEYALRAEKNRKKLNERIDLWLIEQKEAVLNTKRQEHLKADADVVLSEVTKKKSDARKNISLLASLTQLRNVREKVRQGRGEKVSLEDAETFKAIVDCLEKVWEKSLKTYTTEEQGLKLILEHNAQKDIKDMEMKRAANIRYEWEQALFGRRGIKTEEYLALTAAERNLDMFIEIRKSWDTFLVDAKNPRGSSIPIGWVLPEEPKYFDEWKNYLEN